MFFLKIKELKLTNLGPRQYKDEVYFGHMGRAWARLASYYYKDRPIAQLIPSRRPTYADRRNPIKNEEMDSDEEREELVSSLQRSKR